MSYWSFVATFLETINCKHEYTVHNVQYNVNALQKAQANTQNSYDLSMHTSNYSKSQFSRYAVAYLQCVPQPPTDISLSSPLQPAEVLPKYAHLDFIFFPPSPLVPLSLCLHLSAERQLRQTGILDKSVEGEVFGFGWGPIIEQKSQNTCLVLFTSLLLVCRELLVLSN